ncbi:tetratricopeptide repeat protein [Vogesella fluminis]|uniref:tetratricopeptide repeat protein n=1 Tax=Vogesella fluminis TaxID=1069161 RepID=UPI00362E799B
MPPKQRIKTLAAILLTMASTASHADNWQEMQAQLATLSPQDALQALLQAPPAIRQQTEYHYWLGTYALQAGDTQLAITHLEQALLLQPDHAGAWYDYGMALCRDGQRTSCQNILEAAKARYGLPPALQQQTGPAITINGELRSHVGRSSNYNAGSQADRMDILLSGQSISLPLSGDSRAQAASYHDIALDLQLFSHRLPSISLNTGFYARRPISGQQTLAEYGNWHGELSHESGNQRLALNLAVFKDSLLGRQSKIGLWWQGRQAALGWQTGIEQNRTQQQPYLTLNAGSSLILGRAGQIRLTAEQDQRQTTRPGQSQRRLAIGYNLPLLLLQTARLDAGYRWQQARDSAPSAR